MAKTKLLYPGLSYRIIGFIYQIYNDLGFGYQEKYFQRALEAELAESGLRIRREQPYEIKYKSRSLGRYFVDFVVDEKIALEVKVARALHKRYLLQLLS
jgi:GxxExxY protein